MTGRGKLISVAAGHAQVYDGGTRVNYLVHLGTEEAEIYKELWRNPQPNIVRVHRFVPSGTSAFVAMEKLVPLDRYERDLVWFFNTDFTSRNFKPIKEVISNLKNHKPYYFERGERFVHAAERRAVKLYKHVSGAIEQLQSLGFYNHDIHGGNVMKTWGGRKYKMIDMDHVYHL